MNCFNAAASATRLVENLLAAAKAAGSRKQVAAKSILADAALNAEDLSKAGSASIKREAKDLSVDVFRLVNRPGAGVSLQKIIALRNRAKALKDATVSACRR